MITSIQMLKNAQSEIEGMLDTIRLVKERQLNGETPMREAARNIVSVNHIIDKIQAEIAEYNSLKSGSTEYINPSKLEDLPRTITQLRLHYDWSQARLAEEIGVAQQQIARYEVTDYEGISFQRMLALLEAFEAHISIEKIKIDIKGKSFDKFLKPKSVSTDRYEVQKKQIAEIGFFKATVS